MSDKLAERLDAFNYHQPSPGVIQTMTTLRLTYKALVRELDLNIPEHRYKSLAFTALEESAMWAMKALSHTDPHREVISP